MKCVYDLLQVAKEKENKDKKVVAIESGKKIILGPEQCVEDETLFLNVKDLNENEELTGGRLCFYINLEAEENCWKPDNADEENKYMGCQVMVYIGIPTISECPQFVCVSDYYRDIKNIVVTDSEIQLVLQDIA